MKSEKNNLIFYGKKTWPIIHELICILLFIMYCFAWIYLNQSIASNLLRVNVSVVWLLWFSLPILCYFSNKKSYIKLTNIWINIYKPNHYPFFWNMESIKLWYKEIEGITIYYIPRYSLKHNVIITKISENWEEEKIKFYWISNWKELASTLKSKWLNVEYI